MAGGYLLGLCEPIGVQYYFTRQQNRGTCRSHSLGPRLKGSSCLLKYSTFVYQTLWATILHTYSSRSVFKCHWDNFTMLSRLSRARRPPRFPCQKRANVPQRTIIAAPTPSQGPLMSRRADRELPEIPSSSRLWLRTLPVFLVLLTASTLAIFNYQKASSSIVNATLYALRTSEEGREILGDEIYFRDKFPWIWGEMNQLHGRVDIRFGVKGTKGKGIMRFKSVRKTRMGFVSGRGCRHRMTSTDPSIVRNSRMELGNRGWQSNSSSGRGKTRSIQEHSITSRIIAVSEFHIYNSNHIDNMEQKCLASRLFAY